MRGRKWFLLLLMVPVIIALYACQVPDEFPAEEIPVSPTPSQTPANLATATLLPDMPIDAPGSEPERFLPGIVSGSGIQLSLAMHPDGREVYFTRLEGGRGTIFSSRLVDGEWMPPEPMAFSGSDNDIAPFISVDGSLLLFSSDRPCPDELGTDNRFHLWFVPRLEDGWGIPDKIELPLVSAAGERHASLTADGIMYYEADYPEMGGAGVYRCLLIGSMCGWPEPVDAFSGEPGVVEAEPYIAPDESFLLLYSAGKSDNLTPGALVGDVYVAYRNSDGSWSVPENLGEPINSSNEESTPTLSPDGHFLFFASNRGASGEIPDLYWVLMPDTPSGGVPSGRSGLMVEDMLEGFDNDGPVDESWLTPPDAPLPPLHCFEGTLELLGEESGGQIQMLRGELELEHRFLPEFAYQFVQTDDGWLVPVQRGLIIADHPLWNLHLDAGRVWQEAADGDWTRASLPFTLSVKGGNAAFNGTLTFLFNDQAVSNVWYQVTQETTTYTRANLWGLLAAKYDPAVVENAEAIRAAFSAERVNRMPVRPIEDLTLVYPGIDIGAFGRGVTAEHMTWYGVVADGVNYMGGCRTRFGTYPYCEAMRATSYSTAKTAFASVALMVLEQEYGPGVGDLLIQDFVPEAAQSAGDWSDVTFNNAIDMATGNYDQPGFMEDDTSEKMGVFFGAQPYEERIQAAFNAPHQVEPGTKWVYRTSDTFILVSAMQNFLQTKLGENADLFAYVTDRVYRPLGMGEGFFSTMRTADDGWQGQAEGGYGLWWVPDDVAKLAVFLNTGDGLIGDMQVLDPARLAAALQRDPDDRGLVIQQNQYYNDAFWANRYTRANGFDCEFWVTEMQGISGNVIALFPNDVVYYYFSDNQEFTWLAALKEVEKIAPLCP